MQASPGSVLTFNMGRYYLIEQLFIPYIVGEGERKREIPCIVGEGERKRERERYHVLWGRERERERYHVLWGRERERERETNDVLELEASLAVHALQTQMQKFCYISKTTQNLQ